MHCEDPRYVRLVWCLEPCSDGQENAFMRHAVQNRAGLRGVEKLEIYIIRALEWDINMG